MKKDKLLKYFNQHSLPISMQVRIGKDRSYNYPSYFYNVVANEIGLTATSRHHPKGVVSVVSLEWDENFTAKQHLRKIYDMCLVHANTQGAVL